MAYCAANKIKCSRRLTYIIRYQKSSLIFLKTSITLRRVKLLLIFGPIIQAEVFGCSLRLNFSIASFGHASRIKAFYYFLNRLNSRTTGFSASGQAIVVTSGLLSQGNAPPNLSIWADRYRELTAERHIPSGVLPLMIHSSPSLCSRAQVPY